MNKPRENILADILTVLALCALFGVAVALAITPALLIAKWIGVIP